jgi:lipoprotein-anchoring transpeptidase ErfK/SrfK
MMKRLLSFGLFFLLSSQAYAVEVSGTMLEQRLDAIEQKKGSGSYREAQEMYETLLIDPALAKSELKKVRSGYEKFNMEYLFSRFEMPESTWHIVAEGDTLSEIAKKYQTAVGLIKRSNGLANDKIYPGMKLKVLTGKFSIGIDKSENHLSLYLNDKRVKRYRVATGKNSSTPIGQFKIVNKLTDPTWYHAGAIVPSDSPENILGTRWMGFDYEGYGIHGTTEPDSIGKQASAGCVRMRNAEVEELYSIVPVGTQVSITE